MFLPRIDWGLSLSCASSCDDRDGAAVKLHRDNSSARSWPSHHTCVAPHLRWPPVRGGRHSARKWQAV